MKSFKDIHKLAIQRKGGEAELNKLIKPVLSPEQMKKIGDDRYLSMMAKAINQAGFNWTVINNKWPQFEEAMFGFKPEVLELLSPEQWEAYTEDTRVVRNWQKIKAVMENVGLVRQLAREHGSFANFIADWPSDDQVGLMLYLKKHGSRLGGNTGQWFLRSMGKSSFVLSQDVCLALQRAGVDIKTQITSQKELKLAQAQLNAWVEESGLPLTQVSQIAAYSIGENYAGEFISGEIEKFETHQPSVTK